MVQVASAVRLDSDPDVRFSESVPPISAVENHADGVEILWADGRRGRFHPLWLRDNCLCPKCYHPEAWEKTLDLLALDPSETPAEMILDDDAVTITWRTDGHVSRFPNGWLRRNCYDGWALEERSEPRVLWDATIASALPTVEHAAIVGSEEGLRDWLHQLRTYGFSIVRNAPQRTGVVMDAVRRIGFLRETHFGTDFIVESKPNPENVAYTSIELKTHNDLSNCEAPPGIQFLHCIQFDADGGDSILVDGFAAAEKLRQANPDAFDLLAGTPVQYRFHDHDRDIVYRAPMIELDHVGRVKEVRVNRQLEAALDIDHELIVSYITAKQEFVRILRDAAQELRFKLQPGDIMSFHNRRVLHGRAAFDPNSGPRKLEGCYVDCDQAWSRLRVLERGLQQD